MGKRLLLVVIVVVALSTAIGAVWRLNKRDKASEQKTDNTNTAVDNKNINEAPTEQTNNNSIVNSFPSELNNLGFSPQYKETSPNVSNAYNLKAVQETWGLKLSAEEKTYLDKNKFVLVPLNQSRLNQGYNFDEMTTAFDQIGGSYSEYNRAPQNARFVTPDVVLHAYHKFFELTLEELEQNELSASLKNFLQDVYSNLLASSKQAPANLKDSYDRLLAQITVARVLIENQAGTPPANFNTPEDKQKFEQLDAKADSIANAKKIFAKYKSNLPQPIQDSVATELTSIYDSTEIGKSPLFGIYNDDLKTDYTQFTPRSHYTKNSSLRAYFRTMMYLGRSSYNLGKDIGFEDSNLLTREFAVKSTSNRAPLDSWQKIMNVTGFYAGQSDDITYQEWQQFLQNTLGKTNLTAAELGNEDTIKRLTANISALRLPKILSEIVVNPNIANMDKAELLRNSLGFRIFGQRFTFDAWILNNLTAGQEETKVKLPSTPTALFLPAVFGDARAQTHVQDWLKKNNFNDAERENFKSALAEQSSNMSKIKPNEWFASLQGAWSYVLTSLTKQYSSGYPAYMQSDAFPDKQIQTYLGSYTELKHDTLLYAKQSYAELGAGPGGEELPPVVKGFVEPNVLFWRKLLFLVDYNQKLFAENHLFISHEASVRLDEFKKDVEFYLNIAEKELWNKPITEDEYEELRTTNLTYMAKQFNMSDPDDESHKVALIADIHTDALAGQILYEATAQPYLIIALVGNESTPRAVIGVAYNHYELTGPLSKRLTDEDWKKRVYAEKPDLPAKNDWYQSLLVK